MTPPCSSSVIHNDTSIVSDPSIISHKTSFEDGTTDEKRRYYLGITPMLFIYVSKAILFLSTLSANFMGEFSTRVLDSTLHEGKKTMRKPIEQSE